MTKNTPQRHSGHAIHNNAAILYTVYVGVG